MSLPKLTWKSDKNLPAIKRLREYLYPKKPVGGKFSQLSPKEIEKKLQEKKLAEIKERNDKFEKELANTRPILKMDDTVSKIEKEATKLSFLFTEAIQKAIAFQLAMSYAQKMIAQDIGADGSNLEWSTINDYAKKCSSITIVGYLADHFGLSNTQKQEVIDLLTAKLWSPKLKTEAIKPTNNTNENHENHIVQKLVQSLEKIIPSGNMPIYGNTQAQDRIKGRHHGQD